MESVGIADLTVAVGTGFLTSPSALQPVVFNAPNELISVLPLVLIPTFLVPLSILLHLTSILLHLTSLINLQRTTTSLKASGMRASASPAFDVEPHAAVFDGR